MKCFYQLGLNKIIIITWTFVCVCVCVRAEAHPATFEHEESSKT
jgi:hypothetical protein